jgi:hypothetical protein
MADPRIKCGAGKSGMTDVKMIRFLKALNVICFAEVTIRRLLPTTSAVQFMQVRA